MQHITRNEAEKLANDPIGFAMMMDDSQLEDVVVAFVSALLDKNKSRGGKNRETNTEPHSH